MPFTFRYENHRAQSVDTHPGAPTREPSEPVQHQHSVMSGECYRVENDHGNNRRIVTISKPSCLIDSPDSGDTYTLYVGPREPLAVVYVMNESGRTIDTIR